MLSESKTSCFIDGSHISPFDFAVRVIDYAVSRGFEIDEEQYRADILWVNSGEDNEEIFLDILEALDWTYDEALDYLNEIDLHRNRAWYVEDQSLFMEEGIND